VLLLLIQFSSAGESPSESFCDFTGENHRLILSGALIAGLSIYTWDKQVDDYFAADRNSFIYDAGRGMSSFAEFYGRSNSRVAVFYGGLTSFMLVSGWLTESEHFYDTAKLMTLGMAYSVTANFVVKMLIGRKRPYIDQGPHEFEAFAFSKNKDQRSFYSGHTASAFTMMTILAKQYDNPWIKIPAYSFAACVGMQRIESRDHWTSDVIIGAALGYLTGDILVKRSKMKNNSSWSMVPLVTPSSLQILLTF